MTHYPNYPTVVFSAAARDLRPALIAAMVREMTYGGGHVLMHANPATARVNAITALFGEIDRHDAQGDYRPPAAHRRHFLLGRRWQEGGNHPLR